VVIDGEVSGVGEGRSKKDAEQIAATEALQLLADE
jgi:dsRNA-specific ribonuclease